MPAGLLDEMVPGERARETTAQGHAPLALVRPGPGVGNSLALGRLSARQARARCPRGPAVVSSGRLLTSARASNGTRHGPRGTQSGTAPPQWACSEAAVLVRTPHAPAHTDLATLATRHGQGTARSRRAHNRGRAIDGRLKPHVAFAQATWRATEGWRARTTRASHGSSRGTRSPPAHRPERACSWAMSPHQRCRGRTAIPAAARVAWQSVPRLAL